MNELVNEKTMTTKEFAEQLNTSPKVILENARKCLPNKVIENGKPTFWNEAEITVLLDFIKSNNNRTDLTFTTVVKDTNTELTPALKIRKAMLLMQEGYEEELALLRMKTANQRKIIDEQRPKVEFYDDVAGSADVIDMSEVAKLLNVSGLGRNRLFEFLRGKGVLRENNQPYQKYVDAGYFRIIESRFNMPSGDVRISLKTVVFQKGVDYIRKLVQKEG